MFRLRNSKSKDNCAKGVESHRMGGVEEQPLNDNQTRSNSARVNSSP